MKGSSPSSYFLTRKVNEKTVNTGLLADIRRVGMPQRIEKIYSLFVVSEEEKVSKPIFDRSNALPTSAGISSAPAAANAS